MFENAGHLRVHLTTCTNGMFIIRNMLCVGLLNKFLIILAGNSKVLFTLAIENIV